MKKRLFLGFSIEAPWPEISLKGRILDPKDRHVTLCFLGEQNESSALSFFDALPTLPFPLMPCGYADDILFLPSIDKTNVAAYHLSLDETEALKSYQLKVLELLDEKKILPNHRRDSFLPHTTIARKPQQYHVWKKNFIPFPVLLTELHLFESLGNSTYQSLKSREILPPFEEIHHTADLAFKIRGKSFSDLFIHAQIALFFAYPELTPFFRKYENIEDINSVIYHLNQLVVQVDSEIGAPIKAISFHGEVKQEELLTWDLIVDV
jgi:RNA 2',3'-cyclic 3'-phosphodiesterase